MACSISPITKGLGIASHGMVVGNILRIAIFMYGQMVTKRQSVGTTAVVRKLANDFAKISAKNQPASVPHVGEKCLGQRHVRYQG